MAQDIDSLEHLRNRIYRLEVSEKHFTERLDHLDMCVDKLQVKMDRNMQTWDRRWWIGVGLIFALAFSTGGGSFSLKTLLGVLGR